jgi:hypothetical protein
MRFVSVIEWDVQADLFRVLRLAPKQPDAHSRWLDWTPEARGILSFRVRPRLNKGDDDWATYGFLPEHLAGLGLPASNSDQGELIVRRWMRVSRVAVDVDTGDILRYEIEAVVPADAKMQSEWIQGWWMRTHHSDLLRAYDPVALIPPVPVATYKYKEDEAFLPASSAWLHHLSPPASPSLRPMSPLPPSPHKRKRQEEDGADTCQDELLAATSCLPPSCPSKPLDSTQPMAPKRLRMLRQLECSLLVRPPRHAMRV